MLFQLKILLILQVSAAITAFAGYRGPGRCFRNQTGLVRFRAFTKMSWTEVDDIITSKKIGLLLRMTHRAYIYINLYLLPFLCRY